MYKYNSDIIPIIANSTNSTQVPAFLCDIKKEEVTTVWNSYLQIPNLFLKLKPYEIDPSLLSCFNYSLGLIFKLLFVSRDFLTSIIFSNFIIQKCGFYCFELPASKYIEQDTGTWNILLTVSCLCCPSLEYQCWPGADSCSGSRLRKCLQYRRQGPRCEAPVEPLWRRRHRPLPPAAGAGRNQSTEAAG